MSRRILYKKSGCSYLAPRGIFAAGRLTSEFGMGSGVSARQSQPPMDEVRRDVL